MADYTPYLKRVPLFDGMPEAHLQRIANSARERHFEPGRPIVSEGETGHGFYLIVAGRAAGLGQAAGAPPRGRGRPAVPSIL